MISVKAARPVPWARSAVSALARDRRLVAHFWCIATVWPALTIFAAAFEARRIPYYTLSWPQAFGVSFVAAVLLAPNFAIAGLALALTGRTVFGRFGGHALTADISLVRLIAEPALLLLAIVTAAAMLYPAVLGQGFLLPAAELPVRTVFLGLGFGVLVGAGLVCARGHWARLVCALTITGFVVSLAPVAAAAFRSPVVQQPDVIVLGLDSLSQANDVRDLKEWTQATQGSWYSRAVAPGLLTNAVWTSILTTRPVRDHGVFHTFQPFPGSSETILTEATRRGYATVSLFPDQLTCSVGSDAGFDEDRSGPIGWRQLALPLVENASVVLPLLDPLFPLAGWSAVPPNHAGTFTYDVARDIRDMVAMGGRGRGSRTMVLAHLTYLHLPAYPRTWELTLPQLATLIRGNAGQLRDRTFDWQDSDRDGDPIALHAWKIAHLQRVVIDVMETSGYLRRGGRLLLFSDHGDRVGLRADTFDQERYFNVVLASFGLPSKAGDSPVSLGDMDILLGLSERPMDQQPEVEFVLAPPQMWPQLVGSATVDWSGHVHLDEHLLSMVFDDLKSFRPWAASNLSDSRRVVRQQEVRSP